MEVEIARPQSLEFQHVESETANETIERFEHVIEYCSNQDVDMQYEHGRVLLERPNDLYKYLKNNFQHAADILDMALLQKSMRDDDM